MAKPNHTVNVLWEPAPYPPYDVIPYSERPAIDALLLAKLSELITPTQQQKLKGINAPNTDYRDILLLVNGEVRNVVTPPAGKQLVLPTSPEPTATRPRDTAR